MCVVGGMDAESRFRVTRKYVCLSLQEFALGINTNMIATSSPTAVGKYKYFQFISFCGTFYTRLDE
jgi:hypothetical protein